MMIRRKKAIFLKVNVMNIFLANVAVFGVKTVHIFANCFVENI
jgi:hypothetical protein